MGKWVVLLWLVALPAVAIDAAKAMNALGQQAAVAYESGDFAKAAELYQKAFRLDPQPQFLWALARSEHLAGQLDGAIDHYRAFLANPGAEVARVAKANAYLGDAQADWVKENLRQADAANRAGNFTLAAQLYLDVWKSSEAWKLLPSRTDALLKAANAEQQAQKFPRALQHYEEYLQKSPMDAPERTDAQVQMEAIRARPGLADLQPEMTLGQTAPEPPRWPGWITLGGGVVLLGSGVGVLVLATSDKATFEADKQKSADGLVHGLDYQTATTRASAINQRLAIGGVLTGVGVAAIGVGSWLLARHPERVVLVPHAGPGQAGATLAVQF